MNRAIKTGVALLLTATLCQIFLGGSAHAANLPVGQSTDRGISTVHFTNFSAAQAFKLQDVDNRASHLATDESITGKKTFTQSLGGGAFSRITNGSTTVDVGSGNTLAVATEGGSTVSLSTVAGVPTLTINAGDASAVTSVSSANSDINVAGTTTPVLTLNSGTGANQIVKLNGSAAYPAANGAAITSISGANVSGNIPALSAVTNDAQVKRSEMGAASGVATLDGSGLLAMSQVPPGLLGSVTYQGVWNATTNSPTLVSSTGTKGYYYKVSVAGSTTINGNSVWTVGDWIIYNGTTWDRVADAAGTVTSVTGTGPVVSTGGSTPVISMAASTDSVPGYTTAADHAAFAAKQTALVSGSNIKTVGGATLLGAGDVPVGITSISTSTPTTLTSGAVLSSNGSTVTATSTSGTGNVVLTNGATLTGPRETVVSAGTCVTSYNINPASGTMINLTLSGACNITATSLAVGQSFTLYLTQASTTAPTFSSAFKWITAGVQPAWSTSATKYDTVACSSPDGTKLMCAGGADGH